MLFNIQQSMGNYFEEGIQKQQVRQKNRMIRQIYQKATENYQETFWKNIKIISKQNMYKEQYKMQLDHLYDKYKTNQIVQFLINSDYEQEQPQRQFIIMEDQFRKLNNQNKINSALSNKQNTSLFMQLDMLYKSIFKSEQAFNKAAKLFIKWIRIIEVHLKRGFLYNLYKTFFQFLKMEIKKHLENSKIAQQKIYSQESILRDYQQNFEYLKSLIDKFVRLMTKIYINLYRFYEFKQFQEGKLFNDENLYAFVVNYLFQMEEGCLMNLFKQYIRTIKKKEIIEFMIKLNIMRNQPISYFGINEDFLVVLNKMKKQLVFSNAIRILENIKKCHTPISKILILIETVRKIKEQITIYNKQKKQLEKESKSDFDIHKISESDSMLYKINLDCITNIIIYILARVANSEIMIELEIAQQFLTQNSLNSAPGYYLSIFKLGSEYILNSKFDIIY